MSDSRMRILARLKRTSAEFERPTPYNATIVAKDIVSLFKDQAQLAGFQLLELKKSDDLLSLIDDTSEVVAQSHLIGSKILSSTKIRNRIKRFGPADKSTNVAISLAELAVAETGSILVESRGDKEYSLHVLVDEEIILVDKKTIVASLDDCWARLRKTDNQTRVFCFITGPSKTADVEQTLQIGAHGPRKTTLVFY